MKRIICFTLVLLLLFSHAFASHPLRVYDNAGYFSKEQQAKIKERIIELREKQKVDFAFLSTDDLFAKNEQSSIAKLFYNSMGMGVGSNKDGFVCYIDAQTGYCNIFVFGSLAGEVVTKKQYDEIFDQCTIHFLEGRFFDGLMQIIDMIDGYFDAYWADQLSGM